MLLVVIVLAWCGGNELTLKVYIPLTGNDWIYCFHFSLFGQMSQLDLSEQKYKI